MAKMTDNELVVAFADVQRELEDWVRLPRSDWGEPAITVQGLKRDLREAIRLMRLAANRLCCPRA